MPGRPAPIRYVAIQEWFREARPAPYFSALFDRDTTDFYCWTIPKEDMLLVGAALRSGNDAAAKFELLKKKMSGYGYRLETPVRREGALILRPVSICQITTGNDKIALIGEAAGFISPSSCEGFSYAFRNAAALAGSLEAGLEGFAPHYRSKTADIRGNILLKNLKSPFMYNSFIRRIVMKSGVQALKLIE
jgi:flavin-dependent dehydrogenase